MRPHLRIVPDLEMETVAAIRPRRSKAQPLKIAVDDEATEFYSNLSAKEDNAFFVWLAERLADFESPDGALLGLPVERRGEPQLWIDRGYRLRWSVNENLTELHLHATATGTTPC